MKKIQMDYKYFTTEQLELLKQIMEDDKAGKLTDEELRKRMDEVLKLSDKNP